MSKLSDFLVRLHGRRLAEYVERHGLTPPIVADYARDRRKAEWLADTAAALATTEPNPQKARRLRLSARALRQYHGLDREPAHLPSGGRLATIDVYARSLN